MAEGESLERLFTQSFPGITCLRCGNDGFLLKLETALPGEKFVISNNEGETETFYADRVQLICDRCGHIESHLREFLERAEKPIRG